VLSHPLFRKSFGTCANSWPWRDYARRYRLSSHGTPTHVLIGIADKDRCVTLRFKAYWLSTSGWCNLFAGRPLFYFILLLCFILFFYGTIQFVICHKNSRFSLSSLAKSFELRDRQKINATPHY